MKTPVIGMADILLGILCTGAESVQLENDGQEIIWIKLKNSLFFILLLAYPVKFIFNFICVVGKCTEKTFAESRL